MRVYIITWESTKKAMRKPFCTTVQNLREPERWIPLQNQTQGRSLRSSFEPGHKDADLQCYTAPSEIPVWSLCKAQLILGYSLANFIRLAWLIEEAGEFKRLRSFCESCPHLAKNHFSQVINSQQMRFISPMCQLNSFGVSWDKAHLLPRATATYINVGFLIRCY